ncbi:MAG: hypothetical protein AAGH15_27260, partial [Myxococcota bacterium]
DLMSSDAGSNQDHPIEGGPFAGKKIVLTGKLPDAPRSPCSNVITYRWRAPPTTPTIVQTRPESPSPAATIEVSGRADPDARVTLHGDDVCVAPVAEAFADETGGFRAELEVDVGTTTLTARAFADDLASACSAPFAHERTRGASPVFPPGPSVTELETLTVRARLDAAPEAEVRLAGPGGSADARYDPAQDEWRAVVPLAPGPQTIVAETPEGRRPLVEVQRVALPVSLGPIAWDADASAILVVDERNRVLELDPDTGTTLVRFDPGDALIEVATLAASGGVTYVAGPVDTGAIRVLAWTGRALRFVADVSATRPSPEARGLHVRRDGYELLLLVERERLVGIDLVSGEQRVIVPSSGVVRGCFAYDPASDRGYLCEASSIDTVDLERGGFTRGPRLEGDRFFVPRALGWDAREGRLVALDVEGLVGVDLGAARATRLATASFEGSGYQDLIVHPETGAIEATFISRRPRLASIDGSGSVAVRPLFGVGEGAPLGRPRALTRAEGRLLVAAGGDFLELDRSSGQRAANAALAAPSAWASAVYLSSAERLYGFTADGALLAGQLREGAPSALLPAPDAAPFWFDVAVRPRPDGEEAELLTLGLMRESVEAFPPSDPSGARALPVSERGLAIAYDSERQEVGVLIWDPTPAMGEPSRFGLLTVPVAGGEVRRVAWLDDPLRGSVDGDLAWAGGEWFVGRRMTLAAVDTASGALRFERTLPGRVHQLIAPGADGVGYATLQDAHAVLAYDGASGDWVLVAR